METVTQKDLVEYGLSATPLSEEGANALRQLEEAWKLASLDDPNGQETERHMLSRMAAIRKLLWGEQGEQLILPPEKRRKEINIADEKLTLDDYEVAEPTLMSLPLTKATPSQVMTRIRRLLLTGRCSKDQYLRMSLFAVGRARPMIAAAEAVPAGSFKDAGELSDAHARRIAYWACGGKRA